MMAKKYSMAKGFKGHPIATGTINTGTQFGCDSANFIGKEYNPEPESKKKK